MNRLVKPLVLTLTLSMLSINLCLAQTEVQGPVRGVWTVENSPYLCTAMVNIPAQDTLFIEPGVQVLFGGNFQFLIYGLMMAQGEPNDSIRFQAAPENQNNWGGLRFLNADTSCALEYCIIQGGRVLNGQPTDSIASGGNIFISGGRVHVSHSTIVNGGARGMGGGIAVWRSNSIVDNCRIINNESASSGGGMAVVFGSAAAVRQCEFTSNQATDNGGGVYIANNSNAVFVDCRLIENTTSARNGAGGGFFITNTSNPTFDNCVFSTNSVTGAGADGGAGAIRVSSSPIFRNCVFDANRSMDSGGCLYIRGEGVNPLFENCLFSNNTITAGDRAGGALYIREQSGVEIRFSRFFNNVADTGGAVFLREPPRCNIHHNLFQSNGARIGGGAVGVSDNLGNEPLIIRNCTFVEQYHTGLNPVPHTAFARGQSQILINSSIIWDDSPLFAENARVTVNYSNIRGGRDGVENSSEDPRFYSLDSTWYTLDGYSPCIDSGDPDLAADPDETRCDRGWMYLPQNALEGLETDSLYASMTTIDRGVAHLRFRNLTRVPLFLRPMDNFQEGQLAFTGDLSFITRDTQVNSVAYAGDCLYICGGNSGQSPNKIYRVDRQFNLTGNFDQPMDPGGLGYLDLASDGRSTLFAANNQAMVEFTTGGEFGEATELQYTGLPHLSNIRAVGADFRHPRFRGDFYLAGDEDFIVLTDGDFWERGRLPIGSSILALDVKKNSRALYIITSTEDGSNLLSLLLPDEQKSHPLYPLQTRGNYEISCIEVTQDWETGQGMLMVVFRTSEQGENFGDRIVIERLYTSWLVIVPEVKEVLPGEEAEWAIELAGDQVPAGDYESTFFITVNGRGEGGEVFAQLHVDQSGIKESALSMPEGFVMEGAYPNPFNAVTRYCYTLNTAAMVQADLFDLNGRLVSRLENGWRSPGRHWGCIDAAAAPSGTFYLNIKAGAYQQGQMLTLIK